MRRHERWLNQQENEAREFNDKALTDAHNAFIASTNTVLDEFRCLNDGLPFIRAQTQKAKLFVDTKRTVSKLALLSKFGSPEPNTATLIYESKEESDHFETQRNFTPIDLSDFINEWLDKQSKLPLTLNSEHQARLEAEQRLSKTLATLFTSMIINPHESNSRWANHPTLDCAKRIYNLAWIGLNATRFDIFKTKHLYDPELNSHALESLVKALAVQTLEVLYEDSNEVSTSTNHRYIDSCTKALPSYFAHQEVHAELKKARSLSYSITDVIKRHRCLPFTIEQTLYHQIEEDYLGFDEYAAQIVDKRTKEDTDSSSDLALLWKAIIELDDYSNDAKTPLYQSYFLSVEAESEIDWLTRLDYSKALSTDDTVFLLNNFTIEMFTIDEFYNRFESARIAIISLYQQGYFSFDSYLAKIRPLEKRLTLTEDDIDHLPSPIFLLFMAVFTTYDDSQLTHEDYITITQAIYCLVNYDGFIDHSNLNKLPPGINEMLVIDPDIVNYQ